jgi:hypothetical protein
MKTQIVFEISKQSEHKINIILLYENNATLMGYLEHLFNKCGEIMTPLLLTKKKAEESVNYYLEEKHLSILKKILPY